MREGGLLESGLWQMLRLLAWAAQVLHPEHLYYMGSSSPMNGSHRARAGGGSPFLTSILQPVIVTGVKSHPFASMRDQLCCATPIPEHPWDQADSTLLCGSFLCPILFPSASVSQEHFQNKSLAQETPSQVWL